MKSKPKEKKEITTIVLEKSVYTQLKDMKIIPEEPFNSVIKRILVENKKLKGETIGGDDLHVG
jgi:predicted CopG family antitoxin